MSKDETNLSKLVVWDIFVFLGLAAVFVVDFVSMFLICDKFFSPSDKDCYILGFRLFPVLMLSWLIMEVYNCMEAWEESVGCTDLTFLYSVYTRHCSGSNLESQIWIHTLYSGPNRPAFDRFSFPTLAQPTHQEMHSLK